MRFDPAYERLNEQGIVRFIIVPEIGEEEGENDNGIPHSEFQ